MKVGKRFFKMSLLSCFLFFPIAQAMDTPSGLPADSPLAINAKLISTEIGTTPEQYLEAVAKFREMSQIRTSLQPLPINERPLYLQLQSALTAKQIMSKEQKAQSLELYNQVQSDFASYLGLSVPQYIKFMEVINALDFEGAYKNIKFAGKENNRSKEIIQHSVLEEIEVLCDDDCQAAMTGNNTINTRIIIYGTAASAGISQTVNMFSYNPFRVRFVDLNGVNVATQTWVYNDRNGAWRDYSSGDGQHPSY